MDQKVFENVDRYISGLLAAEDDALLATQQATRDAGIPEINVSANQGKFLQLMALCCGAKRILELGTLAGYSTIWMARALPEDGKLFSIEYDRTHAAVAKKNIEDAGLGDKVEIITGKALDILPDLAGPFDMVFIDADKPPYVEYFQWALRLSRPGTIIIADNVIRNGQVLDEDSADEKVQGVQRFNEMLGLCREVEATILQMVGVKEYDGMAIAVVK